METIRNVLESEAGMANVVFMIEDVVKAYYREKKKGEAQCQNQEEQE